MGSRTLPGRFCRHSRERCLRRGPPGYTEYRYTLERPREPLVESWRGQPTGSFLMVIAILPPGYAFDRPLGCDWPIKAKIVGGHLAIYWIFMGDETVEPAWRIAPIGDAALLVECAVTINHRPLPPNCQSRQSLRPRNFMSGPSAGQIPWKEDQMKTPEDCAGTYVAWPRCACYGVLRLRPGRHHAPGSAHIRARLHFGRRLARGRCARSRCGRQRIAIQRVGLRDDR